jgi:hypothetical protein
MDRFFSILAPLVARKDSLLWDSSRLRTSGLTELAPARLTRLRLFADLTGNPDFRMGVSTLLKSGNTDAEIGRAILRPSSPLDLLSPLTGGDPLALPPGISLRLRLRDLGLGLGGPRDTITAHGDVTVEVPSEHQELFSDDRTLVVSDEESLVSIANVQRFSLVVSNEGSAHCWINLRSFAEPHTGIFLTPGGSFNIGLDNPWYGPLAAICLPGQTTRLCISEVSDR